MAFLLYGDEKGRPRSLAHGSGARMENPWMDTVAEKFADLGFQRRGIPAETHRGSMPADRCARPKAALQCKSSPIGGSPKAATAMRNFATQ